MSDELEMCIEFESKEDRERAWLILLNAMNWGHLGKFEVSHSIFESDTDFELATNGVKGFIMAMNMTEDIEEEGGRWLFRETADGYFDLISESLELDGSWWQSATTLTLTARAHKVFMDYRGGKND